MASGVYMIQNSLTGSAYVGSAVDIAGRWRAHLHTLRNHKKSPPKLQRAWDKYGEKTFTFSVLLECPVHDLLVEEQRQIDLLHPKYNTRKDARSNIGLSWSAESNRAKGRPQRLLTHDGVTLGLHAMAQAHGLTPAALKNRLTRGVPLPQALAAPMASHAERGARGVKKGNPGVFTVFGRTDTLKALAAEFSPVSYSAVIRRRCLGWPLERALLEPKCK